MTIKEAVQIIARSVRDTGKPIADAVRELWPQLGQFSFGEERKLMQEALAARVDPHLVNPSRYSVESEVNVSVSAYDHPVMERHEVTCQLLHDTIYHVNGVAKPFALCLKYELQDRMTWVLSMRNGLDRHYNVLKHTVDRMEKTGANKVEDLGEGEQMKIARMLFDIQHGDEPKELADVLAK